MFPCGKCGKNFSSPRGLRQHVRIHGERPYTCDFCSKTFAWKHNAKKHILIHADKPYDCEICDKLFRFSDELTIHLRKHFEIMPHVCLECGEGFDKLHKLRVHNCHSKTKVDNQVIPEQSDITEKIHSFNTEGGELEDVHEKPEDEA